MSSAPSGANREGLRRGIPRLLDFLAAAVGLFVCAPLFGVAALAVRFSSPGPVLFRQRRIGRNGAEFTLLKFRTMDVNRGTVGVTAQDDPRITPIGRWLRRLKLDELPELWNIVRGDMALVGPRPEVPRYVNLLDPMWREVLRARPGLTDPVTLRLRNEEKLLAAAVGDVEDFYVGTLQPFKLFGYVRYLGDRSFTGDLAILLRTAVAVVLPSTVREPSLEEVRAVAQALRRQPRQA